MNKIRTIVYCTIAMIFTAIISVFIYYNKYIGNSWCLKDFVIYVSSELVRWIVMVVFAVSVMNGISDMLNKNQVIRYRNIKCFYGHIIVEIIKMSALFAIGITLILLISGFVLSGKNINNWSSYNSYARRMYGSMLVDVSVIELYIKFIVSIFYMSCILGLLNLITYRFSGSLIIGFVINIALIVAMGYVETINNLIGRSCLTNAVYIKGINIYDTYIYSLIVIGVLILIVINMGYRDFLAKKLD